VEVQNEREKGHFMVSGYRTFFKLVFDLVNLATFPITTSLRSIDLYGDTLSEE
jgi:hypothetical protein